MACETIALTTNINDCCVLQILCDGIINYEFLLSELRIIDKGDSFVLKDRVTSLDLSNYTIDMTAEQIRDARCACSAAAPVGVCDYQVFGSGIATQIDIASADYAVWETYMNATYPGQPDCTVAATVDLGTGLIWAGQMQNGSWVALIRNSY